MTPRPLRWRDRNMNKYDSDTIVINNCCILQYTYNTRFLILIDTCNWYSFCKWQFYWLKVFSQLIFYCTVNNSLKLKWNINESSRHNYNKTSFNMNPLIIIAIKCTSKLITTYYAQIMLIFSHLLWKIFSISFEWMFISIDLKIFKS